MKTEIYNRTEQINRKMFMRIFLIILIVTGVFSVAGTSMAANTSTTCLNNTAGEGDCKDCCDCLEDAEERQACRDSCIAKAESDDGFSNNTDIITIDVPSSLGPEGDYSTATDTGNETDCKTYCDESDDIDCGDRRFCRDACNEEFSASGSNPGQGDSTDNSNGSDGNISLTQALSDEAQVKTIAFSGVAFLTGDMCSNTFFPPGKVSDFFGFQYMRDITPNGFGHNTEYAGRVSNSVLSILTDEQLQELVDMANTQADLVDEYGYKRFSLIQAFLRLLENDLPDATTGLDKTAVTEFTGDLYEIDAEISYNRAKVLGGIVTGLSDAQKTELANLLTSFDTLFENTGEGGTIDSEDWPDSSKEKPNLNSLGLTAKDGNVLVSTFATQLYSWYLGSVEGDTYFCPERHGTCFGSFYMKDIPPIQAAEGVTIDTGLTANMGEAFLDALNDTQENLITNLVDIQQNDMNSIVSTRETISEKLRLFMDGTSVDEDEIKTLVRQYGEFEGTMMYHYATSFAAVGNSLTDAQKTAVMKLRTDYYEEFPAYQADSGAYDCSGAWLYAAKLDEMPEIENTDFLFGSESVVADDAELTLISDIFSFAEGPASDPNGNIFFSDITQNIIYKWSVDLELSVFRNNTGGANGLFFDSEENLLACEGSNQQIVSIDSSADVTVLTNGYNNQPFNEPNDLWAAPNGGVYFTDPVYFTTEIPQGGEHVYYLSPDKSSTIRVIDDMTRPNGIVGTADGTTLYVTDHGAGETYYYTIQSSGALSGKTLFTATGADGMTIDSTGNLYLCCEDGVRVYSSTGTLLETISVPERPTNACFGGVDGETLFITTQTSLFSLQMNIGGTDTSDDIGGQESDSEDNTTGQTQSSCFIGSLF